MRKIIAIITCFSTNIVLAETANLPVAITPTNSAESAISLTPQDLQMLKKLAEKEKLEGYSGVIGTAPANKTISATGAAIEETPSGPQLFIFWTQTLDNGFYYEVRGYIKNNLDTQNPAFPSVPVSSENNPIGTKAAVKLGYNFHVTDDYDITPYLRMEVGKNTTLVYADNNGNYTYSTNYAILPGFKQTFKLTPKLTPYIDIYGGLNQISLTGNYMEGPTPNQTITSSVQQYQLTTEFGFAYKITEHQAIIPYTQFIYNSNNPDAIGAAPYNQGGFNISQLTTSQQVYAIKYSVSW
jgi:hypothetical protein